ncbi:MAG: hypothetical protein JWM56_466 [Candidatus Peribacteria bacterium]|nr:hypothetical protein [Candidatus Peribacteria bacterium]
MLKLSLAAVSLASFIMAPLAMAQTSPFSTAPFTDVSASSPYYVAIEYMRQNNVIRGYLDGTFRANARVNRAEMAQLLTNPLFLNNDGMSDCAVQNTTASDNTVFFTDVQASVWYATPVCIAKQKRILDGYPTGRFEPGNPIIFAEAAKMIVNTFVSDLKVSPTDEKWYTQYIQHLNDLKAVPTAVKTPDQIMTRGEIVEMIYRVKLNGGAKTTTSSTDVR